MPVAAAELRAWIGNYSLYSIARSDVAKLADVDRELGLEHGQTATRLRRLKDV